MAENQTEQTKPKQGDAAADSSAKESDAASQKMSAEANSAPPSDANKGSGSGSDSSASASSSGSDTNATAQAGADTRAASGNGSGTGSGDAQTANGSTPKPETQAAATTPEARTAGSDVCSFNGSDVFSNTDFNYLNLMREGRDLLRSPLDPNSKLTFTDSDLSTMDFDDICTVISSSSTTGAGTDRSTGTGATTTPADTTSQQAAKDSSSEQGWMSWLWDTGTEFVSSAADTIWSAGDKFEDWLFGSSPTGSNGGDGAASDVSPGAGGTPTDNSGEARTDRPAPGTPGDHRGQIDIKQGDGSVDINAVAPTGDRIEHRQTMVDGKPVHEGKIGDTSYRVDDKSAQIRGEGYGLDFNKETGVGRYEATGGNVYEIDTKNNTGVIRDRNGNEIRRMTVEEVRTAEGRIAQQLRVITTLEPGREDSSKVHQVNVTSAEQEAIRQMQAAQAAETPQSGTDFVQDRKGTVFAVSREDGIAVGRMADGTRIIVSENGEKVMVRNGRAYAIETGPDGTQSERVLLGGRRFGRSWLRSDGTVTAGDGSGREVVSADGTLHDSQGRTTEIGANGRSATTTNAEGEQSTVSTNAQGLGVVENARIGTHVYDAANARAQSVDAQGNPEGPAFQVTQQGKLEMSGQTPDGGNFTINDQGMRHTDKDNNTYTYSSDGNFGITDQSGFQLLDIDADGFATFWDGTTIDSQGQVSFGAAVTSYNGEAVAAVGGAVSEAQGTVAAIMGKIGSGHIDIGQVGPLLAHYSKLCGLIGEYPEMAGALFAQLGAVDNAIKQVQYTAAVREFFKARGVTDMTEIMRAIRTNQGASDAYKTIHTHGQPIDSTNNGNNGGRQQNRQPAA